MTEETKNPIFKAPNLPTHAPQVPITGSVSSDKIALTEQPPKIPQQRTAAPQMQKPVVNTHPAGTATPSATRAPIKTPAIGLHTTAAGMSSIGTNGVPPFSNAPSNASFSHTAQTSNTTQTTPIAATGDVFAGTFIERFKLDPKILQTKIAMSIAGGLLFAGILLGAMFFGGSSKPVTYQGLTGVVGNPHARGKGRCGAVETTRGCVLYLVNPSHRDREGRDFYQQASDLTGVPKYNINLNNTDYANRLIRPGNIAEINIPAIR